jgi:diaminohydroxyphosphoribosylaminopyrimidine deaminase / 5-amino-6-(5-phosphoribosylamino)uracil reductase
MKTDLEYMRLALRLARRGYGRTSPNPMVGAVLVKRGEIIGRGWHRRAGEPHAEVEAVRDAVSRRKNPRGATLYVTLEPCSSFGRTPPCTEAVREAGIKKVVFGAVDPNPDHAGAACEILGEAGVEVVKGVLAEEIARLNESFNYWITRRRPFVTVKAGMSLDGRIATRTGDSKWITSEKSRAWAMRLRQGADAILVGVNTVLADNPRLTIRVGKMKSGQDRYSQESVKRRLVLDGLARTPLQARLVSDEFAAGTTIFVSRLAPKGRVEALGKKVKVRVAPDDGGKLALGAILRELGEEGVTSLLVEGGGRVHASFLMQRFVQRVAFFYSPKLIGGWDAPRAVAGNGAASLPECLVLRQVQWRRLGPDLFLNARVCAGGPIALPD